jgi:SnoaL-like domain
MTPLETSLSAENAFYRAFEQGDLEQMMSVWALGVEINCIHPLGTVLSGAPAIRASWVEIFQAQLPRKVEVERVNLIQTPDLAIHTVFETIVLPLHRQRLPPLLATNIYRRIEASWRMVLHHASPIGMTDPTTSDRRDSAATRH